MKTVWSGHLQDHFRKVAILERVSKKWDWNEEKFISKAEYGRRNIPLTTYLISVSTSKLLGLSVKAGKFSQKKKKELSDVTMSPVERVP